MPLSAFIDANLDAIVTGWEAYARTLEPAAGSMSQQALRSLSREMLVAIVADMQASGTEDERAGAATRTGLASAAVPTSATLHGALRHAAGFDLPQLVSEFRALRSSVLALWRRCDSAGETASAIDEIARFNEALDQALYESVQRYSNAAAASRDMFLAVLGHDLRSPLQAIEIASHALTQAALSDATRLQVGMRVKRASKAMNRLITDLLEFTRSRLGRAMPIERSPCDLGQLCEEALDAARASYPLQLFEPQLSGDLRIPVDPARLLQALSNLLNNAVQHGDPGEPVSLGAHGDERCVVVVIANAGPPIPPDALRVIFDPLVQLPTTVAELNHRSATSLGLGLFIVREIVLGHHGTIDVQSSAETGTAFTIRLPRELLQG